jgi:hypothetical protein
MEYDFVMERTYNGKRFRMLAIIINEYTKECLAIQVDRKLNSTSPESASKPLASQKPLISQFLQQEP